MKCVILASGKGTRLQPLTLKTPKPMIQIAGKPIIEHNMEFIYEHVDEIILVVKHLAEQFREYFGDDFKGTSIRYVTQSEEKGTAAALRGIQETDDVLVLYGDSIFENQDIEKIIQLDGYGCLVQQVSEPEKYGIFLKNLDGTAEKVIEKPTEDYGNLANAGVFKFSSKIFTYVHDVELSLREEYELTDAINLFCKNEAFQLVEMSGEFVDIGYPEDVEKADAILREKLYTKPKSGDFTVLERIAGYSLSLGIPAHQIEKLIAYSQDTTDVELQKNTNDLKRFSSFEKFDAWYNDTDRYLFCMLDEDMKLAGIYWGRPAKMPIIQEVINQAVYDELKQNQQYIHTNGIRIYGGYRGKRLAKVLFQAEKHYENIFSPCYWSTDVNQDNPASCKGFEKGGYVHMANGKNVNGGKEEDNNRRIYVKISKR